MARAVALDLLREKIRELEGNAVQSQRVHTGVHTLDALIGGLPQPGVVEVHGPPGSGRTRLALALTAALTAQGALVAWVDADHTLYPPAAADLAVVLRRLLVVRPPHERAAWAAEQLLRSGCFPLVAISGLSRLGHAGQRWSLAAEAGGCTALVISEQSIRELPAVVRLSLGEGEATVLRDRGGRTGRSVALPAWPEVADPWA